ncbi:MAG: phosphatase PAP2 family protein [Myxococcales bacterium]|nr:phosphatase PAP2 family protein [Myxococcales bacterium]
MGRLSRVVAEVRQRVELTTVALVTLITGGLWFFVEIADEVAEGEARRFDEAILLALRTPGAVDDPIGPLWFEEVVRDLSALGGVAILCGAALAAVGYLLATRRRRAALLVFVAVAGGQLLSMALKLGFARPRPDLVPHGMAVHSASFPSGHSMLSAIVWLTLGVLLARLHPRRTIKLYIVAWATALTLLVGASRVYLGVHWPTDVLAGWAMGAVWAMGCWTVARWLHRRGTMPDATTDPGAEGHAGPSPTSA